MPGRQAAPRDPSFYSRHEQRKLMTRLLFFAAIPPYVMVAVLAILAYGPS